MWQQWHMLLVGNAIIGLIEGAVIARVFKTRYLSTIVLMIIANYASGWAGALLFGLGETPSPIPDNIFDEPLYRVGWLMWIGMAIALAMSIAIEWPFCLVAMIGKHAALKRSLLAALLAQASSYTCIGLSYLRGENTLGREVEVMRSLHVDPALLRGSIYFIAPDGDVWAIRLDGTNAHRAVEAGISDYSTALCAMREPDVDGNPWRLIALSGSRQRGLLESLQGRIDGFRMDPNRGGAEMEFVMHSSSLGYQGVADLRDVEDRGWCARPRGNNGIEVENSATNERYDVRYDTVFTSWWGRCVTVLPGDLAIFELGRQVCMLDMSRRQITLLARGRGPVVVMDVVADDATERTPR
jgi:hypothetical protein